jgi:outer membrane protein assembly factor BamB
MADSSDRPDLPFAADWQVELPRWASLPLVASERALLVRANVDLVAVDPRGGKVRWKARVSSDEGDRGRFLLAAGDRVLTDAQVGRDALTEVVAIAEGEVAWRAELGCIVGHGGAALVGDDLVAVGIDPSTGPVLRSVDAGGKRRLGVPLADGANTIALTGERLLVCNRAASPGLYTVNRDGGDARTMEETPAQEMAVAGGRVLAALRVADYPRRDLQARDLATGKVLWTARCHGAVLALDSEVAAHLEPTSAGPVLALRDAATGAVRWRASQPVADDSGHIDLAGPLVAFGHGTGMALHRRADGASVGDEVLFGTNIVQAGERLYLSCMNWLVCAKPPA